jgi:hypothetical protein
MGAMTLMAQNKSRALGGALAGEAGMDLVRQSAAQVSGGNEQMTENLVGGFAFHSRNAGRLDLGGESAGRSLLDGWGRSSVAQHAQSFGASMQAFASDIAPRINRQANDTDAAGNFLMDQGVDAHTLATETAAARDTRRQQRAHTDRRASGIALLEMQNMLPMATGENQNIINDTLARVGVDHTLGISVEQQLADIANGLAPGAAGPVLVGGGPAVEGGDLRSSARVYDAQTPFGERGGPPTPTPTAPTPGS